MKMLELFKRPSGKAVAQREIELAQREYIRNMIESEKHASMSAHHLNEAERFRNSIVWLQEFINK